MIFLVIDAVSSGDVAKQVKVNAWVNTDSQAEARSIAEKHLSLAAWAVREIVECTVTREDDYFPPCKSLDAYKKAQANGVIALRYFV